MLEERFQTTIIGTLATNFATHVEVSRQCVIDVVSRHGEASTFSQIVIMFGKFGKFLDSG